jgi:ribosomal protein L21E
MPHFKPGDRVRLVTRAQTEEDMKSGLYYEHFGGMTGIVQKIYGPQEIAVEIEPESLPQEIRQRHENVRDQMKTKWLEGLSEEGLSPSIYHSCLRCGPAKTSSQAASSDSICQEPSPTRKTTADLEAAEEAELRRRSHRVEEGKRA